MLQYLDEIRQDGHTSLESVCIFDTATGRDAPTHVKLKSRVLMYVQPERSPGKWTRCQSLDYGHCREIRVTRAHETRDRNYVIASGYNDDTHSSRSQIFAHVYERIFSPFDL
jgi:hypothetical protein